MKKLILSSIILFTGFVQAQLDRSVMPSPAPQKENDLKESEVFTTANGITVILSENHKIPKVSFDLSMGSDSRMEGTKAGLSEMSGSLIMSGTNNRSKDQLDKEIDYIGASLSADKNSMFLSCLTKHVDKGLSLMSDVLINANFPQSEFDRIKKQNENALMSAKSDANTMAQNAVVKVNFPNHPYSDVMTEATLNNITREDVVNYFKTSFTPKGSYLVVVGDITRQQTEELLNKYFGSWSGEGALENRFDAGNFSKGNRVVFVKKPGAVQSVVYVTFPVKIMQGDKNQLPLTVLNNIFGGGGFGTRLMQNLREDKAYTYGCYSSLNIQDDGAWLSAGGNFRNAVTDSAVTQILSEFEKITTEFVKDEELNLTKSTMNGKFAISLENPQTIARFALNIIKNKLPKDYYRNYLQRLESVNKQDVLDMAQQYFTSKNCNIVVVGNEEIIDKLKKFDSDGKIELFDAFGNEVKEMKKADISKEQLIDNYIYAVTQTKSKKELSKKLKKIKSYERVTDLSSAKIPIPLKMSDYWMAPETEAQKMEGQGMVFQKSFYDGKSGFTYNMQAGKKEMTSQEMASKKKSSGLFPEMNYAKNGTNYDLIGVENQNGIDFYVVKTVEDSSESYDYFNKTTFLKEKSVSIRKQGDETIESTNVLGDYKDVGGILFPHSMSMSFGEMTFSGKVSKMVVNEKIDLKDFKD
ncbi:MAG: insulinase family protein [Bacteroidetes bacterium]|nr:insulinase family protein [Bacteroidota bacterium]